MNKPIKKWILITSRKPGSLPDPQKAFEMEEYIKQIRKEGDTVGGIITVIQNVSNGRTCFQQTACRIGKGYAFYQCCEGFEYGSGFAGAIDRQQSQHLYNNDGTTQTNQSGGIQGGISNGMDIANVAFKPVATIMQSQQSSTTKEKL